MQKQNNRTSKIADIGELDQRIRLMKIKTYSRSPNTYQPLERNVAFTNVWAKVSALHGQGYYTAVSVKPKKQLSLIVHYRPDTDEKINTWFDGWSHSIGFIDSVKYRDEHLEIKVSYSGGV